MVDFDSAFSSAQRKAWMLGIVGAVVSSPFSLVGGALSGSCCFLMSFIGAVAVVIIPVITGFVAAFLMDYETVPAGGGIGVGAGLGVRAAAVSALLGAVLSWLVSTGFMLIMDLVHTVGTDDIKDLLVPLLMSSVFSLVSNAVVCFLAGVVGTVFGAAAGAVAGAIKGK